METKQFTVHIDGELLEVASAVREADDDLLFFIHGLSCSKDSFRSFWNRPDFMQNSALAIDLPGFGDSSKPDVFSYTMHDQARVCTEILTMYSDKRLHLVTHSMGCAVALLLPDGILNTTSTFACIEGNLIGADCGVVSRRVISVIRETFEREEFQGLKNLLDLGEGYYAMGSTSPNAMYKSAESLVTWSDGNELLKKYLALPCRKMYFYGERNASHPTLRFLEGIPKVGIRDSGHFPMTDNPDDFYSELHRFILERIVPACR
ncbi:MAG TPA: alpha/beta hydrolase [Anaerolineales bacterium]|nr:alpha/beta hydrolase [Anaerolineales bacterium]